VYGVYKNGDSSFVINDDKFQNNDQVFKQLNGWRVTVCLYERMTGVASAGGSSNPKKSKKQNLYKL